MNLSKRLFSLTLFPILIALAVSAAFGQPDASSPAPQLAEPTYEVSLHVIIGSDEAGGAAALPTGLANVTRTLRGNFRVMQNGFQARSFRFGARVPVRVGTTRDSAGAVTPVVNYEPVGLTMNMIGLPANTPTLIGTISLPKTTGTIFLVATVRTAAM